MEPEIIQVKPEYGKTYEAGLVGFSFIPGSFVSEGITVFTKGEATSGLCVSHAFLVENEDYCIEATGEGVVRNRLSHYFDPKYRVFFKRPKDLKDRRTDLVLDAARSKLGQPYSIGGIVGFALSRICNLAELFPNGKKWRNPFNSCSTWICSELVAFSLYCLPEYRESSQLLKEYHPSRISPQLLFESDLFEKWTLLSAGDIRKRYDGLILGEIPQSVL